MNYKTKCLIILQIKVYSVLNTANSTERLQKALGAVSPPCTYLTGTTDGKTHFVFPKEKKGEKNPIGQIF